MKTFYFVIKHCWEESHTESDVAKLAYCGNSGSKSTQFNVIALPSIQRSFYLFSNKKFMF